MQCYGSRRIQNFNRNRSCPGKGYAQLPKHRKSSKDNYYLVSLGMAFKKNIGLRVVSMKVE